jgi:hypothetical protein
MHLVAIGQLLLQKSKIAEPLIFRENANRQMIADSIALNRVTEVAREFNAGGRVALTSLRENRTQSPQNF